MIVSFELYSESEYQPPGAAQENPRRRDMMRDIIF